MFRVSGLGMFRGLGVEGLGRIGLKGFIGSAGFMAV